jgi:hypothetical protein
MGDRHMRAVLRRLLCIVPLLLLAFGLCPAQADDAEMVKEKLFQAKKDYDAEVQKFKKAVSEMLDKREEDARKKGDKKQVDQIKAEREAFEKTGESPQMVTNSIREPVTAGRKKLDKAYASAVKEYLRLKMDDAAGATEKEQQEFNFSSVILYGKRTFVSSLKPFNIRAVDDKAYAFEKDSDKYKMNGEVIPHSLFTHPDGNGEASVSYTLAGKMAAFRTSIGIPRHEDGQGDPASPVTFEVLGDGKSLWKSEQVTKIDTFQTCTIKVEHVKTLTLQVHCGDFRRAHAVWFGPIAFE